MTMPIVALVGRPNVGKSTLFNCLTQSRDALVADQPGVTRDRQYGHANWDDIPFIVIDTGGIQQANNDVGSLALRQTELAMREADVLILMTDARAGLLAADQELIAYLRTLNKPLVVVVNKIDGIDPEIALTDFFGLTKLLPFAVSAAHRRGISELVSHIAQYFPVQTEISPNKSGIKIAVAGRPNVGKSTLINRLLGEDRVIVCDQAGTTRDSLYLPLKRLDKDYLLIDTAGVRRRGQVKDAIEKLSVVKTLQAVEAADIVIFVLDARAEVAEQDLHLLDFIVTAGKGLIIAINKWDGLTAVQRQTLKRSIDRRLHFVDFAKFTFISALHGTGVGDLFKMAETIYAAATKKLMTPRLNQILQKALMAHQPPMSRGHRIKLRYVHAGGQQPPLLVIHGNQAQALPDAYRRYLINTFRQALKLMGTPIRVELRNSDNPFKDKPSLLTERQQRRRQRLIKHRKGKS